MKPNFTDDRGTITDLLVTPDYSITQVTFTPGAVRGNHYHEQTVQYDFVLKGTIKCVTSLNGEKKEVTLHQGDTLIHPANQAHAYTTTEASELLSICYGIRKGDDYEKDVIRLETPLI